MEPEKSSLTQKALSFWGGILIVWSIYRSYFKLPIEVDEFLIKPLIFIGPVIYFIQKIEKKPLFKTLWLEKINLTKDLTFSLLTGAGILSTYLILKAVGIINLTFNLKLLTLNFIALNLATAISEEILSHGFVLKKLYEEKKDILQSSFTASVLYFILRIPILFTQPALTGDALLYTMITSFLLSFALSLLFLYRKSLWSPIFLHFFYLVFTETFLISQ